MATVPVPRTWVTDETVDATTLNGVNGVKGPLEFLLSTPRLSVYQTAVTTLTSSGTTYLLSWDSEDWDTDSMHSTVTNTSRLFAYATGLYSVSGVVGFAANATGYRTVNVRRNSAGNSAGGTNIGTVRLAATATLSAHLPFAKDVQMTSGDYLEVFATQSSGGSVDTVTGSANTFFQLRFVANS